MRGAHVLAVATEGSTEVAGTPRRWSTCPSTDWLLQPLLAVIPLQLLAYYIAQHKRPERGPAAQPRQDRHGRVARWSGSTCSRSSGSSSVLERRPRIADRLFTAAEREYAASKARPGQHLAARFCAKEAVAKALALEGWSFTDVEVVATGGAPGRAPERQRRRPGRRAGREGPPVADPHRHHSGRGGPGPVSTLPGWLDPLFEAQEMRDVDAWAIDTQGVPSLDLMERAGEGLARITAAAARPGPIRIVVGKGNNGGDGLVVARLLREEGREVDVLAVADLGGLEGDAKANLDRLPGDPPQEFTADALEGSGAVLDAMLGTGFSGEPREPIASAIAAINDQDAPVVACDVPSGVDAEHRPRGGPGGPGHGDRDLPRPEGGPVRGARRAARGPGRADRHRRAPGRADARSGRA